jgi:FkbM family methyltransferase
MLEVALVRIGQLIGKPPGWERFVRALAPPAQFASRSLQLARQPEGFAFPVDRGTLIGWSVHFFGTYEPEVRTEIRRVLGPGDVAVDVGANVGWHTLLMAACVGPAGRVYSFEPNPTTRGRLQAAVAANELSQVTVESRALAEANRLAGFAAPAAGHVWDGTGRLTAEAPGGLGSVECITLDAFVAEGGIDRLALVKIDVEGWELAVLRGAGRVLETLRPVVVFEFDPAYVSRCGGSADALTLCVQDAGYDLYLLSPRRAPERIEALGERGGNILAMPRGGRA